MKKTFKKALSAVLAASMVASSGVLQLAGALPSYAADKSIPNKVLFETSFEEGQNDSLLSSTLEGNHLSNVIKTDPPTGGGNGLSVLYETIDGSSDYLGSECKYNLFDGKTSTKFLTGDSAVYLVFALEEAAVVRSYSIASANDEESRDPKNWTLYGSDDGKEWTILDKREGISFSSRQQTKSFGFDNSKSFGWYKFEVNANAGGSLTQFSNLDLFTEEYDDGGEGFVDTTITVGEMESFLSSANFNDGAQTTKEIFDGSTGTKWIAAGGENGDVWVSFKLKNALAVNAYEISVCNDHHKRDPKSWKFYGSMDGEDWVLLDTQENQSFAKFYQTNRYVIENETAYLYYKLGDISHVAVDDVGLNITHLSELRVLNVPADDGSEEGTTQLEIQVNTLTLKGSTASNSNEGPANLFDGDLSSKLCTSYNGSFSIEVQLVTPAIVNSYCLGSGADAPARDPKDWKVYGSDDGESWILLDTREDEDLPDRSSYYSYDFENTTAYSWYKLELLANNGSDDWGYDLFQLSEWEMGYKTPEEAAKPEPMRVTVDTTAVTGSASLSGDQGILQIFDGTVSTKVCIPYTTTLWVTAKLTAAAAVNTYKIASANDHEQRDPKDWTLYGSNDGESWTALDVRSDEDMPERNSYYTYTFNNSTEYLYYKLDITSNNGKDGVGLDVVQFSEWQLFVDESLVFEEEEETKPVKAEIDTATITGSADLGGGESKVNLFDGKTSTKMVCSGSTFTVSFTLSASTVIKGYAITSANDWLERSPKSWNFYGSLDGEEWTKLDSRSSITFNDYFEEQIFGIANETAYLYYKLEVTENSGNAYTQFSELTLFSVLDESYLPLEIPGMVTEPAFGPISTECNAPGAWSGFKCLGVYGQQTATGGTYARNVIFKDLSIPVTANTRLSYVIFPGLFNIHAYDYEYTSCRVVIDLKFTDGTYLSELGAKDQYGSLMTPQGQVDGECLYTAQWNYVESAIGEMAEGKTIEKICVYFDMENAEDASKFMTFFDDLKIEDKEEVVYEHLSDYINILRGTNNDVAFSRGMCTPGVTLPGGFNFFTPVNNADSPTLPYTYQQSRNGNPLDSISVIHAPNFWIGSYGSFQFMANTSVDTSAGTAGITATEISSRNREAAYSHVNEKASAHLYSVMLAEGSPASGVKIEVTPTMHGAYVRFVFPEGSDNVNVIFDSLWGGSASLTFAEDGKSFIASTTHGSPSMYVYGSFDSAYTSASAVNGASGIVSFPEGTTVVEMKLATSFISAEQAEKNLSLEFAEGDTFDTVLAAAQKEWDDLCGKFEIEGASYHELVSFYSSLYRMYAFPSLFSENEGTNEEPVWTYRSPYDGKKVEGLLYTNNGFWDTYRTAWPGYSLFTENKASEYLDGMVGHYTESGWVPRWMGPGPVNCMVGTSSDIIFADAYIKGIEFDYEAAFESMLRSASSYSSEMAAAGRKENNTAPYKGYIANDNPVTGAFVQEAFSSSIEGYINDYGIYRMAEAMGLEDEAEYYLNRCKNYVLLFNEDASFFMGKSSAGVWSSTDFDPAKWNGDQYDFTESVGWVNAFPAVFDGQGMVNLYGSPEALTEKLDALFDDSIDAMKEVVELYSVHHEISEFKEVKMGQYMHNNQPSHHVIYTYAFSSTPYKVQEYVREVLRHVYVGSEIGQGYPGDEDNGEMSAWYVFNALGFYPYSVASGEYMIGSPLFDKVTVHLDNGKDIVIVAKGNSDENIYIQSAKVNGEDYDKMYLTHEQLTSGCVIEFEMGSEPSAWGSSEDAKPTSLTGVDEETTAGLADIENGCITNGITTEENLFDDDSLTVSAIEEGAEVIFDSGSSAEVALITLTSGDKDKAPTAMDVQVSNDGINWVTVEKSEELSWLFDNFIRPFAIPEGTRGNYRYYKLTLYGGSELAEIEFLGKSTADAQLTDMPSAMDLDASGTVTISDVTVLLDLLAGKIEDVAANGDPDITADGAVTIGDVTALLDHLAGK